MKNLILKFGKIKEGDQWVDWNYLGYWYARLKGKRSIGWLKLTLLVFHEKSKKKEDD